MRRERSILTVDYKVREHCHVHNTGQYYCPNVPLMRLAI